MAFFDWDMDGKKDIVDDYIEYNIYQECTKNVDTNNYSNKTSNSGCAFWFWFSVIMMILGLLTNCD